MFRLTIKSVRCVIADIMYILSGAPIKALIDIILWLSAI